MPNDLFGNNRRKYKDTFSTIGILLSKADGIEAMLTIPRLGIKDLKLTFCASEISTQKYIFKSS